MTRLIESAKAEGRWLYVVTYHDGPSSPIKGSLLFKRPEDARRVAAVLSDLTEEEKPNACEACTQGWAHNIATCPNTPEHLRPAFSLGKTSRRWVIGCDPECSHCAEVRLEAEDGGVVRVGDRVDDASTLRNLAAESLAIAPDVLANAAALGSPPPRACIDAGECQRKVIEAERDAYRAALQPFAEAHYVEVYGYGGRALKPNAFRPEDVQAAKDLYYKGKP